MARITYKQHGFGDTRHLKVGIKEKYTRQEIYKVMQLAVLHGITVTEGVIKKPWDSDYPHINIEIDHGGDIYLNQSQYPGTNGVSWISRREFMAILTGKKKLPQPFSEEFQLNDSRTATITKEGIKVGCETFTHDTIRRLANRCTHAKAADF